MKESDIMGVVEETASRKVAEEETMAAKEIRFHADARERMLRGIDILSNAVRVTWSKSRNVVLDNPLAHRASQGTGHRRQGDRARRQIREHGAQMVREVPRKRATSLATVRRLPPSSPRRSCARRPGGRCGHESDDLKRGIDRAVEAVVKDIEKRSKKVSTNDEIAQVGTVSANNDHEIGRMIAEAMQKVGNEGVITVEEAKSLEIELDVVEGMQFDRGYISLIS